MGASGVVFMMILLSSFTNFSHGEIPLTFILVLILYLGVQLYNSFGSDNISQFAHIIGGLCGSFFGFLRPPRRNL
jgi:membrane associated rhomboid family serine protease